MSFDGKVVLITGASRGIGRATAEAFVANNAVVIGAASTIIGTEVISGFLGKKGKGLVLDVVDRASIDRAMAIIHAEFGGIDILINNAGIVCDHLLIRMRDEEWSDIIHTNLTSVFRLSKAVLKSMIRNRFGRVITLGSVVGSIGNTGQAHYAAAKAGLIGFSKSLAKEVASRGVTVNVVAPGFVETDMTRALTDNQRAEILSSVPVNRLGDAKEIASAILFLASDQASYITGETLHINGGMYMS